MAFCTNCGHQLADGAKFCFECGVRVNAPTAPPEEQRKTVYDGEIHKCPNCGEVINAFISICPACGFEFRGTKISASLQEFIDKVDQCDERIANSVHKQTGWGSWSKTKKVLWVLFNLCFMGLPLVVYFAWPLVTITMTPKLTADERQLAVLVENFPFPNDRESVLAALMYAKEKIDFISREKVNRKSAYWMRLWCAKAEQLKQKADMMFPNDPVVKDNYNEILADEARVKKALKTKSIVGVVILAIVIIFAIFRYGVLDQVGVTGGTDYSATFEWQNYGLFTQVPEPDTNNGKIVRESTDQIHIELYHVSAEDFNNYVKECKNVGFTVDITKTDQVFYAHDGEGYDLSVFFHEDKKTMDIYVDSYDIDDEKQQTNIGITSPNLTDSGSKNQETTASTENTNSIVVNPNVSVADDTQINYYSVDCLTITDFGYQQNDEYIWCVVEFTNPSLDKAVELPTYRVTAYDKDNKILGSEEHTLSIVYPGQKFVCAAVLIEVGQKPHRIDITVLEPDDYNITAVSSLEHPVHKQMVGQNMSIRNNSITGEIHNPNDYKIDSAMITVIFRDNNGAIVYSRLGFVDQIPANGSVPFDIDLFSAENLTSTYEVYAYIW